MAKEHLRGRKNFGKVKRETFVLFGLGYLCFDTHITVIIYTIFNALFQKTTLLWF